MTFHTLTFTHHARRFTIEAEDWSSEEAATAAMLDLQGWTLQLDPALTIALHNALKAETTALLHDAAYDRDMGPLPALRVAQREAVRSGLGGHLAEGGLPVVTLEAA